MTAGVSGANDMMLAMTQILMKSMEQQTEMMTKVLQVGLETSFSAEKMALAQNIIDVYA